MPETRRELFRTSVAAAVGVAAGAVAGYAAAETFLAPQALVPGNAGSVIAVYDYKKKAWYLFHFEADRQKCRMYTPGTTPSIADETRVDTVSWFTVCRNVIVQQTTISYTKTDGTTATIDVQFDADGYVEDGSVNSSLQNLLALLGSTNTFSGPLQVAGSWNEIGKQTHS